ncbi:GGDEF domain-containing protein [Paracidobacterium acidisoli]|nr:GGDEF domain-containing protein [Paracidobacterium acidisoli]MBT9331644.1 GGDEF domain-containing protein [Paracidobacterium acidisoli]
MASLQRFYKFAVLALLCCLPQAHAKPGVLHGSRVPSVAELCSQSHAALLAGKMILPALWHDLLARSVPGRHAAGSPVAAFYAATAAPHLALLLSVLVAALAALVGVIALYIGRSLQFKTRQHTLEEVLRDRTRELELSREAFRIRNLHDDLTGLLNRNGILKVLDREIARAARNGDALTIVLIDIDNFSAINDLYGYISGDAALFQFAAILRNAVRDYDQVGRCGNGEFLAVLPGLTPCAAQDRLPGLHNSISNVTIATEAGTFTLTCSCGAAAAFLTGTPPTAELLLGYAEQALEAAERRGSDQYAVRLPEMGALPQKNGNTRAGAH